jgi:hypothetical protein
MSRKTATFFSCRKNQGFYYLFRPEEVLQNKEQFATVSFLLSACPSSFDKQRLANLPFETLAKRLNSGVGNLTLELKK